MQPNSRPLLHTAGTYTFHQWKVLSPEGQLLGVYTGDSATITIVDNGCRIARNASVGEATPVTTAAVAGRIVDGCGSSGGDPGVAFGAYRRRGEALGMAIWVSV